MVVLKHLQIQLKNEAARLVTGPTRSVSLEKLYKECGWETLESGRKSFKLHFMFKVSNNLVPHYIEELIPPLVGNRTQYELRNSQNFDNLYARTSLLQKSLPVLLFVFGIISNKK